MLTARLVKNKAREYLVWPDTVGDFTTRHVGDKHYELRHGPIAQTGYTVQTELSFPKRHTLYRVDVEHTDANDDETGAELWFLLEVERAGRWFKWGQMTTRANDFTFFARQGGERRGETRFRVSTNAPVNDRVYVAVEVEDRHFGG